jgi:hypothetical protein
MISNHLTDEEATAYHEAGHAVVGALRDRWPIFITIVAEGGVAGKTEFPDDWPPEYQRYLGDSPAKRICIETRVLIAVAGTIAHDLLVPNRDHDSGDDCDSRRALGFIECCACWAEDNRDGYLRQIQTRARDVLETNWPWVEAVASALIERKTLLKAEVMELRPSG